MEIVNLGSRIVNNFLIASSDRYILVDTGYENGYPAFRKALQRRRISLDDIPYLFLTHAHDDHAGFLNQLLRESPSLKVIASEKALEGLRRGQNSFAGGCSTRLAWAFCRFMSCLGKGEHRFPPVEERFFDRFWVVNEQTKPAIEKKLSAKIIETPGHTACSLSLLLENGALFCGDAAMNGFPSLYRATIWMENSGDFAASWQKIIALRPTLLYPGHGKPFPASDLERYLPRVHRLNAYPLAPKK